MAIPPDDPPRPPDAGARDDDEALPAERPDEGTTSADEAPAAASQAATRVPTSGRPGRPGPGSPDRPLAGDDTAVPVSERADDTATTIGGRAADTADTADTAATADTDAGRTDATVSERADDTATTIGGRTDATVSGRTAETTADAGRTADTETRAATAATQRDGTADTAPAGTAATERVATGPTIPDVDAEASAAADETAFIRPLEKGLVIGDLTLLYKLGEGAQGVVWAAREASLQRDVAVKVLTLSHVRGPDQIKRFQREAEAAGRLQHPAIVATHGFRQWKGSHLIVQELLRGGDLDAEITRRHAAEGSRADDLCAWAADLTQSLALALQHAHEHGVIHRDIKPSNILLDEAGAPKLTDFGLALVDDDRGITRTGVAMGTPFYMSPEQVRAERGGLDHRTDVYSLGAVLYRMLTGEVPFTGKTREGLLLDILGRDPAAPRRLKPGLDRDLEAICLKCLEKDPDDRYRSMAELAADLERQRRGEGISARQLTMVDLPFRRMRRLATSGLVFFATLAPVAWLALDLGVLKPAAVDDVSLHELRLLPLGLATLLCLWPLSVLTVRLARGRRWLRWPVVAVVLLLGGLQAVAIEGQRLDQLQGASRADLDAATHEDDAARTERLLASHVERWGERFGNADLISVAYAHLRRGQVAQAVELALQLDGAGGNVEVAAALQFAAHSLLAEDDQAAAALARLQASSHSLDAGEALRIGDVFTLTGHLGHAREMYRLAATQGADNQLVNFAIARLDTLQCRWDEAADHNRAASSFIGGERVGPTRRAISIAIERGEWDEVDTRLAKLAEQSPSDHLELAFGALVRRGRTDEALALLDDVVGRHADDREVVRVAAYLLFQRYATTGDPQLLEQAERRYQQLAELEGGAGEAALGLFSVHWQLGQIDAAAAQAERALALEPDNPDARFAWSQIVLRQAIAAHGAPDAWPQRTVRGWVDAVEAVLDVDVFHVRALNNAAYARGLLARASGDDGHLLRGLQLATAGVRRTAPPEGGECTLPLAARVERSRLLDTRSQLHEWSADPAAALADARAALAALDPGDPDHAKRQARVAALESAG